MKHGHRSTAMSRPGSYTSGQTVTLVIVEAPSGLDLHERRLLMATTKFHFSEPEHGLDDRVAATRLREHALARMVMAYIGTGLAFMLLPGTFLGVWNLLSISNNMLRTRSLRRGIQAHGQAQVFGWIGTFILGIGFYSIPKMRRSQPFAMWGSVGLLGRVEHRSPAALGCHSV